MCIELGMLEGAPVPILVGHDVIELEYLQRKEGHLLELEPYRVNVVTRQQSRKAKAGGMETSQGLVTQLATEAEGEEGEIRTPSDCNQPLAIEETSYLDVGLSDSPREESCQSVAEETEALGEKLKGIPKGEGALLTGAPELSADCLAGQEEFRQEFLEDPTWRNSGMAQEQETEFIPDKRKQLGFPSKILTDRGGNFLAEVMKCLWECCGVKHLKTTAYHPQTNGLIERFNGTLKGMLNAYVDCNPNDWDEKLPHLLFAYQEVPQESTGFSPFELMFRRRVRGPLNLVREEWEGKISSTKTSMVEYVLSFHQKLTDMMKVARDSLA
ncbi:hypothetical protein Y1Q_0019684 [Alligator mississippiensis]|uniref:Integrase catalytic domain-containing protein n=1 Tax=Alligator mississippiensis TaxID=8496 RepID=A0A151PER0_ALLMI|nr:hypothetical protein Y1Q_0019684 [Alligator mississippiensis]